MFVSSALQRVLEHGLGLGITELSEGLTDKIQGYGQLRLSQPLGLSLLLVV